MRLARSTNAMIERRLDPLTGDLYPVVQLTLSEITRCQTQNIPNVSVAIPEGVRGLVQLLVQEVREAGYLAEAGAASQSVEVTIPPGLLPGEPQAEFGRCGTHGIPLQERDRRMPPGPPYCRHCGMWRRPI
jgi:hypothetical protein